MLTRVSPLYASTIASPDSAPDVRTTPVIIPVASRVASMSAMACPGATAILVASFSCRASFQYSGMPRPPLGTNATAYSPGGTERVYDPSGATSACAKAPVASSVAVTHPATGEPSITNVIDPWMTPSSARRASTPPRSSPAVTRTAVALRSPYASSQNSPANVGSAGSKRTR